MNQIVDRQLEQIAQLTTTGLTEQTGLQPNAQIALDQPAAIVPFDNDLTFEAEAIPGDQPTICPYSN
jgi:hypothetical protein